MSKKSMIFRSVKNFSKRLSALLDIIMSILVIPTGFFRNPVRLSMGDISVGGTIASFFRIVLSYRSNR